MDLVDSAQVHANKVKWSWDDLEAHVKVVGRFHESIQ